MLYRRLTGAVLVPAWTLAVVHLCAADCLAMPPRNGEPESSAGDSCAIGHSVSLGDQPPAQGYIESKPAGDCPECVPSSSRFLVNITPRRVQLNLSVEYQLVPDLRKFKETLSSKVHL